MKIGKLIIGVIVALSLSLSACTNKSNKESLHVSAEDMKPLAELDSVESIWTTDMSERFSYITANAGNEVIFFDIDYVFPSNLFIYQSEIDGKVKYGYMDEYFNKVTEPLSNDPNIFYLGRARVTEDGGSYLIDDNLVRIDEYYPGFMIYDDDLLIIDWTDKPPEEHNIIADVDFDSFLVPVKSNIEISDEGKPLYGYMTLNDAIANKKTSDEDYVIPPMYEAGDLFYEGLAAVKVENQWGYINESGQMIIEPQYDIARKFYQGCAQVYDADYHTPNDVLKPGFTDNNDLGRWGMINTRGNSVSSFWYTSMTPFIGDLSFAVRASPPYYKSSFYHILRPDGTYAFSLGNLFGRDGNEFAGEPIPFSEGLMPVQFNYYVYINENGDKVFNVEFENARGFSDGMAAVQTDDKIRWGYIDTSGDMVLPDIYTYACEFNEGYAYVRVRLSAKGYLIDKAGNHYLEDLELNGITKFNENGYALGFKKEKVEVEKNNEKVWVDFYTYYIIHFNY